jgi:Tol biopolymer transport system component
VAVDAAVGAAHASLTPDGQMIYMNGVARRQLVMIGANGVERPLGDPGAYSWPRLSPDGRRIAVSVGTFARRQVWVYELPNGPFTQVTGTGDINDRAEWFGDSRTLLFRSDRDGRNAIYAQAAEGGADARRLYIDDVAQIDEGILSPDERLLLVQRDSTGDGELWLIPLADGAPARRLDPVNGMYGGRFSPDGRWIAFAGGGTGVAQAVFLRQADGLGGRVRISGEGGNTPVWSGDGRQITYAQGRELLRVTVISTDPLRVSDPRVVLSGPYVFNTVHADFDVTSDGRSILALRSPDQSARMVVVRNLGAELRQRSQSAPK